MRPSYSHSRLSALAVSAFAATAVLPGVANAAPAATTSASQPAATTASPSTYLDRTVTAAQDLIDTYYNNATGLFAGQWWNTGAILTQLADLQCYRPNATTPSVPWLLSNTYAKHANTKSGFLNSFYDDEGWWSLAWIAAYDLTGDNRYLQTAVDIWYDIKGGWQDSVCGGGGVWWNKSRDSINAVENELFLSISAHLANRVSNPANKTMYIDWARKEWNWFVGSGMLDLSGKKPVQDGINITTCKPKQSALTYTQGVVIGGLLELDRASSSPDLIGNATMIGSVAVAAPLFRSPTTGIFLEPVGGYDNNTAQLKGIFSRNLRLLNRKVPTKAYVDFATLNADSIWDTARNAEGLIGPRWDRNNLTVWASSHGSGIGGLLAAGAMLGDNNSKNIPVT